MCLLQNGNTAFIWAARNCQSSTVETLVNAGASLDIQNKVGVVDSIESEYISYLSIDLDAL